MAEYSHTISSLEIWTVDDETITLSQDIGHQSLSDAALYPRIMETSNSPVWKPNLPLLYSWCFSVSIHSLLLQVWNMDVS